MMKMMKAPVRIIARISPHSLKEKIIRIVMEENHQKIMIYQSTQIFSMKSPLISMIYQPVIIIDLEPIYNPASKTYCHLIMVKQIHLQV